MSNSAGFALVTGSLEYLRSILANKASSRPVTWRGASALIHTNFHFSTKPTGKLCFLFHKVHHHVVIVAEVPAHFLKLIIGSGISRYSWHVNSSVVYQTGNMGKRDWS